MTVKISRVMLTIAAVTALTALVPAAASAGKQAKRDVLVVSNNWAGTADLIDPHTFERLDRINVIPDAKKRIAEIHADPTATAFFDLIRELIGEGHNQYVDDGFTSPDGRVVYFSRPSFADVVAIDLKTEKIVWRTKVGGYRADHMAISDDGRRAARLRVDGQRRRRDQDEDGQDHRASSPPVTLPTRTTSRPTAS